MKGQGRNRMDAGAWEFQLSPRRSQNPALAEVLSLTDRPRRATARIGLGAAIVLGMMLGAFTWPVVGPALAAPKCVFLECGPAETPNPTPAQAPVVVKLKPVASPQHEGLARPHLEGEVCNEVSGFNYCVSSVLAPQYGFNYLPRNLVDSDLTTAWVEGTKGHGEGESLVVDLDGTRTITALQVMNGYHKNERLFLANSRVHVAELQFSNGHSRRVSLADRPGVQTIEVGAQKAEWVRFTIRSVYPGTKYDDTAVTEFRVVIRD